ncbi:uncharacterized protein DNG_00051 [Cephalotrichum gorgonifer]|uniref:Uncharacterized protein n=1 Tax=Cephalotrichum gorgonifer TaxID=2041049 RepID=A0AAE8MNL6_9PEZI|nr:uncharacterized protein DNG_00051 [Cephalotrichum gorgonifer]
MACHASMPLALHLRSLVKGNAFTNEHYKPGEMYQEGRTLESFAFLDQRSGRADSTLLFASIFRIFYEHPDWSQLHTFFTKRYTRRQMLVDRAARTLVAPEDDLHPPRSKKVVTNFLTDPSSVGLPKDLAQKLGAAGKAVRAGIIGPDPQPAAIGPAISIAVGAGAYMELVYAGKPPGMYPELQRIGPDLYGWRDGKLRPVITATATAKRGGRGRVWEEWAELWTVVAEWVYEHDSTSLENLYLNHHTYKYRLSDEERRTKIGYSRKLPRDILATDAIDAADAVRDVFAQLAANPIKFQGIEWGFLELLVGDEVQEEFYSRFGRKGNLEGLTRRIAPGGLNGPDYSEVSSVMLKRCPDTFNGLDWESWFLSIDGGDVVGVHTPFQALWVMILLRQLPVNIEIVGKGDKFPKHGDPDTVYL